MRMARKVMIVPVGFELDRVIDAQKFESCNVWHVLRNPRGGSDAVGEHSIYFGERVAKKVEAMHLLDFQVIEVRQSDLLGLVRAMAGIVKAERAKDPAGEFVFNASSSTKTAAFAVTLVAGLCPAPVKILYLRPEVEITLMDLIVSGEKTLDDVRQVFLEHGECHSPFGAEYYPVIPLVTFTPAERAIIEHLASTRVAETVSSLVQAIAPGQKQRLRKDLVKAGWSVKALERMHLVTSRKANQSRTVAITPEGEVIAAALGMIDDGEGNNNLDQII